MCRWRLPAFAGLQHGAAVDGLRRERRTNADFPLFLQRGEGFPRQAQAADRGVHLAIAEARQRAHRHKQRAACPRRQLHRRQLTLGQGHQPAGGKMHLQGLRFIGQIAEIQRQTRSVAAGEEARSVQLGDDRGGHHHFIFAAAKVIRRPGLSHHPQFAVKITDRQRHRPFALIVQHHRLRLLGDDGHMVNRRFTATF